MVPDSTGPEATLGRCRGGFEMGNPAAHVAHPDGIELALATEVPDCPFQEQLRRLQPCVCELARLLLGDQVQLGKGAQLSLDRTAAVERAPAPGVSSSCEPLRGELGGDVRIRSGEALSSGD